jgi:hypothetical protein
MQGRGGLPDKSYKNKAQGPLERLRHWEAAIYGDAKNGLLPPHAFAAEHLLPDNRFGESRTCTAGAGSRGSSEFAEGAALLFGNTHVDSDGDGGRRKARETAAKNKMRLAAAAGDSNAVALEALLWGVAGGSGAAAGGGEGGRGASGGFAEEAEAVQVLLVHAGLSY